MARSTTRKRKRIPVIRLYHFTRREDAPLIVAHGFKGENCWLSPSPEAIDGETSRSALLEVCLTLTEAELKPYEKPAVWDETWDEEKGCFVKDGDTFTCPWYDIPPALIARKGSIRLVPPEERARIMRGEID